MTLFLKFTVTTSKISIEPIQHSSCLWGLCNLCIAYLDTQLNSNTRAEKQHATMQLAVKETICWKCWRNTNHHRNWAYVFSQSTQNWMMNCVIHCRQNSDRENFCSSLIFKYIILKGKLDKTSIMHKKRDLEGHHYHKTLIGLTTHNTITHALRFLLTLHTHAQQYQSQIFIQ